MFTPDDLRVRRFREEDQGEVLRMISYIQSEEENAELRRQIKLMFLNPTLWVAAGVTICVVGISLNIPPVPASIGMLALAWMVSKRHFQSYWATVRAIFNSKADDLQDVKSFYVDDAANPGGKRRRLFLVAEHRGRVVGTVAVREAPGMPPEAKTCKVFRLFVHPATRRMGIASALIREAERVAREEMGYGRAALRTHKTNAGGLKLYQAAGYTKRSEDVFAAAYPLQYLTVNFEKLLDQEEQQDSSS